MSRRFLIFIIFTCAFFLSFFYQLANAVIANDLAADLSLSSAELGLMTSVFFATFAAAQIPLGIGLDRWGARWVTPCLMLIGVVGSLLFATSSSLALLTIGRGLIGFGMAGIFMGALKMFSQWYPPDRFATMSGLLLGIGSTGAFFATTPMAWLNGQFGWRAVFVGMAIATLLVAVAIMAFTRNTPPNVAWPKPEQGQGQGQGGIIQVLSNVNFWRLALVNFFVTGIGLAFQGLWAGTYLFDIYGLSQIDGGNVLLLIAIGSTVGYISAGWLGDRFDLVRVFIAAAVLFIASQLALALRPPLVVVGVAFFLFGFAFAFNLLILAHARRLFPDSITGQAVSTINLFGFLGTFLIQWLMGVIISRFASDASGAYPPVAYTTVLLVTLVCTLIALARYYPLARSSNPQTIVTRLDSGCKLCFLKYTSQK